MYEDDRMFRNGVLIAAIILIIISVLGVIGYVGNEISRRSKEIGVRKVFGSSSLEIMRLIMENIVRVPYIDSDKIFCSVLGIDIQITANTVSATLVPQGLYCIDRQKGDAKVVTKYLFDPLFEYEFVEGDKRDENPTYLASVLFGFNNYAVNKDVYAVAAAAYKVKEYIRLSLENPDFPADKKAQLRELDNQLEKTGIRLCLSGRKNDFPIGNY